jgi:hypothetical protein
MLFCMMATHNMTIWLNVMPVDVPVRWFNMMVTDKGRPNATHGLVLIDRRARSIGRAVMRPLFDHYG